VVAVLAATAASGVTIAAAVEFPAVGAMLGRGAGLPGTAGYLWNLNAADSEGVYVAACLLVPLAGFVVSGFVGALAFSRELPGDEHAPPAGDGGRSDGGPPRDPVPPAPLAPPAGRSPEVPARRPLLTG
jgi:hypothetical protein